MSLSLSALQRKPPELGHHPLWRSLPALDPETLQEISGMAYNPFGGALASELPLPPQPVHGGILAG